MIPTTYKIAASVKFLLTATALARTKAMAAQASIKTGIRSLLIGSLLTLTVATTAPNAQTIFIEFDNNSQRTIRVLSAEQSLGPDSPLGAELVMECTGDEGADSSAPARVDLLSSLLSSGDEIRRSVVLPDCQGTNVTAFIAAPIDEFGNPGSFNVRLLNADSAAIDPDSESFSFLILIGLPDLSVTISPDTLNVRLGEPASFIVTVRNNGFVPNAPGAMLGVRLPPLLRLSEAPENCSVNALLSRCPVDELNENESQQFRFTVLAGAASLSGDQTVVVDVLNANATTSNDTDQALVTVLSGSGGGEGDTSSLLLNISTNGFVDNDGMLAGFIVIGQGEQRFAVVAEEQSAIDPVLEISRFEQGRIGAMVASNDDWRSHASASELTAGVGREPLSSTSAGMVVTLTPGQYIAQVRGFNNGIGRAVVSVQQIGESDNARLINISTNGVVDSNGMLAGFIIAGSQAKRVAVLAENLGAGDPRVDVVSFDDGIVGDVIAFNGDWRSHPTAAEVLSKLREPLSEQSAAFATTLPPGTYLARVTNAGNGSARVVISVQEISN